MEFMQIVLDNGVLLLLLMIGLIQAAIVIFKIEGTRNIYMVSCGIGLVLMLAYQLSYFGIPSNTRSWFNVVAFGLLVGVLAPSIYSAGEKLVGNAAEVIVEKLQALIGK